MIWQSVEEEYELLMTEIKGFRLHNELEQPGAPSDPLDASEVKPSSSLPTCLAVTSLLCNCWWMQYLCFVPHLQECV